MANRTGFTTPEEFFAEMRRRQACAKLAAEPCRYERYWHQIRPYRPDDHDPGRGEYRYRKVT